MTEGVSVGICDDVLLWREEITDKVLAYQTEKQIQITIKQYSCAEDHLKAQDDIDILFLVRNVRNCVKRYFDSK